MIKRSGMPGLDRTVPGDAAFHRVGDQRHRRQGARAGDDAVQDHRHPQRRRAQDEPGQRGMLQAAERGQDADRVRRIGLVPGQARGAPRRPSARA